MAFTLLPEDAGTASTPPKGKFTLLPEDTLKPDPTGSTMENMAAGAGKALVDTGRGLRQIGSFVPGLNRLDMFNRDKVNAEVDESKRLDTPLMATGGGIAGNLAANVAMTVALPVGNTKRAAGAIGAGLGFVQPVAEGESRMVNTGVGGAAGVAGKVLGDKAAEVFTSRLQSAEAAAAAKAAQNQTKDATLAASREAGYVVPPTSANPTKVNQLLEGVSGKIKTAQVASERNQGVTNNLARQALGIGEDVPLTSDTLNALRRQAGQAYEVVRGSGEVWRDPKLTAALDSLAAKYTGAAKDFPDAVSADVPKLLDALRVSKFDAGSGVDMIAILRDQADKAYRAGDKALGKAAKGAADAMEGQLERHLELTQGQTGALDAFREARKLIAKTYSVQGALNEATGNVDARKLAAQLNKGRPLSGELRQAGEFAQAFPKAAQEIRDSVPATSPLDWWAGVSGAAASGNPAVLGVVAARPMVRNMLLSQGYQGAMTTPSYAPGTANRLAAQIAGNPTFRAMLPGVAAAAPVVYGSQ